MRYFFLVTTRATAGRNEALEQWYKDVHLAEILKIEGFKAARHFVPVPAPGIPAGDFLAVYEVEADSPEIILQRLQAATPSLTLSEALDASSVRMQFYRENTGQSHD